LEAATIIHQVLGDRRPGLGALGFALFVFNSAPKAR
jgi:hypothetical protein